MNWDAIGAIGELLGAAVTVATLLYLAIQIRHNREATQASTEIEASTQLSLSAARIADNAELQRIWDLVATNDPNLTVSEADYFAWNMSVSMHIFEGVWEQFQKGLVSDRIWGAYQRSGSAILRTPLMKLWWKKRVASYSSEFYDYFDAILEKEPAWVMPHGDGWIREFFHKSTNTKTKDHNERDDET